MLQGTNTFYVFILLSSINRIISVNKGPSPIISNEHSGRYCIAETIYLNPFFSTKRPVDSILVVLYFISKLCNDLEVKLKSLIFIPICCTIIFSGNAPRESNLFFHSSLIGNKKSKISKLLLYEGSHFSRIFSHLHHTHDI